MDDVNKFEADKRVILSVYNEALNEFGETPKGITWGSAESQCTRFQVLSEIGSLHEKSVLDFGSGYGDLFGFLRFGKDIILKSYLGVDLNPTLVDVAREKYPAAQFEVRDVLLDPLGESSFDFVLASGSLGIATPNWREFSYALLCELFRECRVGLGANFLTTYSPTKTGSHYVDPSEILRFVCTKLSPKVVLRQDYKENDFTIYVYK